jgi:hypothetical protein
VADLLAVALADADKSINNTGKPLIDAVFDTQMISEALRELDKTEAYRKFESLIKQVFSK